jgi:hypothetical protein
MYTRSVACNILNSVKCNVRCSSYKALRYQWCASLACTRKLRIVADCDALCCVVIALCVLLLNHQQSVREFTQQDMLVPWHHLDRMRTQQQTTTTTAATAAPVTLSNSSDTGRTADSSTSCATEVTDTTSTERTDMTSTQQVW